MSTILSKTRFRSGLQCIKKLWFDGTKTIEPAPPTAADQLRFKRGQQVEVIARERFEKCLLIDSQKIDEAADATSRAIQGSAPFIAQATFIQDELLAKVDILQRNSDNTWNVIEIKMSGELKKEHVPDVAFQKHVTELSGLKISKCFVMYLNKECVFPNLDNLFVLDDVTDSVREYEEEIASHASSFLTILGQEEEPDVRVGGRCTKPHNCNFRDHCWKDVPLHSIFTIPRLGDKKSDLLLDDDIWEVINVPTDFKLTDIQKRYVDLIKKGLPEIDKKQIATAISGLKYPLYFLDFESDKPPIPQYDGMRPFSRFPFQFSLHILNQDGTVKHHSFLHTENSDCRLKIAEELDKHIGDTGHVVVYHKSFEEGELKSLASFAKPYENKMLSIVDRLWDQEDIFKDMYLHPSFAGKTSIKVVLEILVPTLSYDELDVSGGESAVAAWVKLVETQDENLKKSLEKYCELDTLAMVEIHKHFKVIAGN